jgi:hypothetical protein
MPRFLFFVSCLEDGFEEKELIDDVKGDEPVPLEAEQARKKNG